MGFFFFFFVTVSSSDPSPSSINCSSHMMRSSSSSSLLSHALSLPLLLHFTTRRSTPDPGECALPPSRWRASTSRQSRQLLPPLSLHTGVAQMTLCPTSKTLTGLWRGKITRSCDRLRRFRTRNPPLPQPSCRYTCSHHDRRTNRHKG